MSETISVNREKAKTCFFFWTYLAPSQECTLRVQMREKCSHNVHVNITNLQYHYKVAF